MSEKNYPNERISSFLPSPSPNFAIGNAPHTDDYPQRRKSVEKPVGRADSYTTATTRLRNQQHTSEENIDTLPLHRGTNRTPLHGLLVTRHASEKRKLLETPYVAKRNMGRGHTTKTERRRCDRNRYCTPHLVCRLRSIYEVPSPRPMVSVSRQSAPSSFLLRARCAPEKPRLPPRVRAFRQTPQRKLGNFR